MKFKKDGKVYDDIDALLHETCFAGTHYHCGSFMIRDMFFGEDERVMQFHPPKSEYINNHPYCLHLWKPVDTEIPHPPMICV